MPASVQRFVAVHIDSVSQLEVLLLLRAAPEKVWTVSEVGRALAKPDSAAAGWLQDLTARGLAAKVKEGYRYDPPEELEGTVDELAVSYAKYRVTVVSLIFAKPSDRITGLADAFRFRKKR